MPNNQLCLGLQVLPQVLQQVKENHPNKKDFIINNFNLHSLRFEKNTSTAWKKKAAMNN